MSPSLPEWSKEFRQAKKQREERPTQSYDRENET